ncbi:MAG TPA: DUF2336 domain-containing protein [Stellaceae bacterium]|nr:DUF2336 domain-containing protein [Stellaceae bacterium]
MEQFARLSLISSPGTGVLDNPSWIRRAMLIEQVAEGYADGLFTSAQRRVAEDLFRTAVYDGEALVRSVLADSLKRLGSLPRDIILTLARDEAQVARPVLSCSPLLSEDDLLELARTGSRSHRLAIAERDNLSPALSEALYETRDPIVARRLLVNDGAAVAEGMLHAILDTLGDAPGIVEAMARRRLLPVSILERLQHYRIAERPRAQASAALRA